MEPWRARLVGCFAFQGNNTTRAFEYPWIFETVSPSPGMKLLEIGGSLSGLQFALNLAGCDVVNVDPEMIFSRDFGRRQPRTSIASIAFLARRSH
jgi:hypothetical protein